MTSDTQLPRHMEPGSTGVLFCFALLLFFVVLLLLLFVVVFCCFCCWGAEGGLNSVRHCHGIKSLPASAAKQATLLVN